MIEILHHLGHRWSWNLRSMVDDGSGDGTIIGARYVDMKKALAMSEGIRIASLFDPQFYMPGHAAGKLGTYPFFPANLTDDYSTSDFEEGHAAICAESCLAFQNDCNFKYCVIPTHYRQGSAREIIDSQTSLFVQPFLDVYARQGLEKPLLLQLILTGQMLKDSTFSTEILNWVTGLQSISGLYLIVESSGNSKQIEDIDLLTALLDFIFGLRQSGMEVITGYVNTEALLLLAADITGVGIGSYENLRRFGLRPFQLPQEGGGPPNVRLYSPKLLQWIDHNYIGALHRMGFNPNALFGDSPYCVTMLQPSYEWWVSKSEPYMHYFSVFSSQLRAISELPLASRIPALQSTMTLALEEFDRIRTAGIILDADSGAKHVPAWLTALNLFAGSHGLT